MEGAANPQPSRSAYHPDRPASATGFAPQGEPGALGLASSRLRRPDAVVGEWAS